MPVSDKVTMHRSHDKRTTSAPQLKAASILQGPICVPNEITPGDIRRGTDPPNNRLLLKWGGN